VAKQSGQGWAKVDEQSHDTFAFHDEIEGAFIPPFVVCLRALAVSSHGGATWNDAPRRSFWPPAASSQPLGVELPSCNRVHRAARCVHG
jgi:hypothetical protein